jgi:hypothetical protein
MREPGPPVARGILLVLGFVTLFLHFAFNGEYGFFRDEALLHCLR